MLKNAEVPSRPNSRPPRHRAPAQPVYNQTNTLIAPPAKGLKLSSRTGCRMSADSCRLVAASQAEKDPPHAGTRRQFGLHRFMNLAGQLFIVRGSRQCNFEHRASRGALRYRPPSQVRRSAGGENPNPARLSDWATPTSFAAASADRNRRDFLVGPIFRSFFSAGAWNFKK